MRNAFILLVVGAACVFLIPVRSSSPNAVAFLRPNVEASTRPSEKRAVAVFTVRNGTNSNATIEQIVTSCACVSATDKLGEVISPGQSIELTFLADVPNVGDRRTTVRVKHSLSPKPLVGTITVTGRKDPPIVESYQNGSPTFFAVPPGGETQEVVVRTKERKGSIPWVHRLSIDAPGVVVSAPRIAEEFPNGVSFMYRTYTFQVAIPNGLPPGHEVAKDLWVETNGDRAERIKIGSVRAASVGQVVSSHEIGQR